MKTFRNLFLLLIILVSSCNQDDEVISDGLTQFQRDVIVYFNEVALGFEFGDYREITRKWISPMKIYVWGDASDENLEELRRIVQEINLLSTDGFEIVEASDSLDANYFIHFGSASSYSAAFPETASQTLSNWGLFYIYFNQRAELIGGHMYVDIVRADPEAQKHLLREELTQSIGLARDSPRYPNSIFQSSWTTVTDYSEIDRELIRLLYHPNMVVGLEELGTDAIIRNIFKEENAD